MSREPLPGRERPLSRSARPIWQQALEGIGLVVLVTAVVVAVGSFLALTVSLIF